MVMVITRLISTDTPVKIKTQGIENRIPSTCILSIKHNYTSNNLQYIALKKIKI